jgi:glycine dehydrogenase
LARPGDLGADVCHMNLHKTFCIPHGGGGPGIGPIGVAAHLAPFLPGHVAGGTETGGGGSPLRLGVDPADHVDVHPHDGRFWAEACDGDGDPVGKLRRRAPESALSGALCKGRNGRVAHECILDTRVLKDSAGVTVEDIAKRLIDYGFHAPTMSWPVAGTLMVEPTESEPKRELDRFCEAMIGIAVGSGQGRRRLLAEGRQPARQRAAHRGRGDGRRMGLMPIRARSRPSRRARADFAAKYWPPVSRIDNVGGDRNLVCACPPVEALAS